MPLSVSEYWLVCVMSVDNDLLRVSHSECRASCWCSVEVCAVLVSLQDGIVEKLEEH